MKYGEKNSQPMSVMYFFIIVSPLGGARDRIVTQYTTLTQSAVQH